MGGEGFLDALGIGGSDALGLSMPDHARIVLGIAPWRPARARIVPAGTAGGEAAELLRQISTARYVDASVIGVLQGKQMPSACLTAG